MDTGPELTALDALFLIEEAFGCDKKIGTMRRARFKGLARVGVAFSFTAAVYNLGRLPKLLAT